MIEEPLSQLEPVVNSDGTFRQEWHSWLIRLVATLNSGGAGTTILSGSVAPTSGLGKVGDYYLDTVAHILYGPKAASGTVWPIAIS